MFQAGKTRTCHFPSTTSTSSPLTWTIWRAKISLGITQPRRWKLTHTPSSSAYSQWYARGLSLWWCRKTSDSWPTPTSLSFTCASVKVSSLGKPSYLILAYLRSSATSAWIASIRKRLFGRPPTGRPSLSCAMPTLTFSSYLSSFRWRLTFTSVWTSCWPWEIHSIRMTVVWSYTTPVSSLLRSSLTRWVYNVSRTSTTKTSPFYQCTNALFSPSSSSRSTSFSLRRV